MVGEFGVGVGADAAGPGKDRFDVRKASKKTGPARA
ncbi:hypothetical protein SDC9_04523 [bioreactor metagenome]|uniref:Uncharacterized protein n=1 Tax=bioreactor metagenome TaxID=1076179 RepID=A0A644SWF1_9ZZZZ